MAHIILFRPELRTRCTVGHHCDVCHRGERIANWRTVLAGVARVAPDVRGTQIVLRLMEGPFVQPMHYIYVYIYYIHYT